MSQQRHATNPEDLQLKLSLKKKIWTGAHGEPDGRPLGWYRGNNQAQTQANMAAVMAATAQQRSLGGANMQRYVFATNTRDALGLSSSGGGGGGGGGAGGVGTTIAAPLPPAYLGAPRRPRKLEQVDLFK